MTDKRKLASEKMLERWDAVAEMLGVKDKSFFGGVENCEFSVQTLSKLLDLGVLLPEYRQNESPSIGTFFEFGKRSETTGAAISFTGFIEPKTRKDCRVVIDGVEVTNFADSVSLILDFAQTFHSADEFTANAELLRAWYD